MMKHQLHETPKYICDLCKRAYGEQFKFFEHLKTHYEVDTAKNNKKVTTVPMAGAVTQSPTTTTNNNVNLLSEYQAAKILVEASTSSSSNNNAFNNGTTILQQQQQQQLQHVSSMGSGHHHRLVSNTTTTTNNNNPGGGGVVASSMIRLVQVQHEDLVGAHHKLIDQDGNHIKLAIDGGVGEVNSGRTLSTTICPSAGGEMILPSEINDDDDDVKFTPASMDTTVAKKVVLKCGKCKRTYRKEKTYQAHINSCQKGDHQHHVNEDLLLDGDSSNSNSNNNKTPKLSTRVSTTN
jgi:hypothetical protein